MDEKTRILISIGAAVAANCIPCFEHYNQLRLQSGISDKEIDAVIALGEKVKNGASIATKQSVRDIMEGNDSPVTGSACGCG